MKTLPVRNSRFVVALWRVAARFTPRGTPRPHKPWIAVLLAFVSLWTANAASAQTMVGLGTLSGAPNSNSRANAVSADDLTIVGFSTNSQGFTEAFLWTAAGGMKGLGTLADNALHPYSNARAVSADGSIVVGDSINSQGDYEAFVWTAATGMLGLGALPSDYPGSFASGVSADGSVVVGISYILGGGSVEAFIWTAATGMVGLGALAGNSSGASGVSADGSTVVGSSSSAHGEQAFIWTAATGMVGLGVLPGAFFSGSFATGISRDGSTVVGTSTGYDLDDNYVAEGFVWTAATGMQGLGTLPLAATTDSVALGVSGNGSTVVGYSYGYDLDYNYVSEAFLWTADTGMVGLGTLSGAPFLDSTAYSVSADGFIVVGVSRSATSSQEAFILNLTPPDPADLTADLIQEVRSLNLQHGIENSLDSKLNAAFDVLETGNATAAVNSLNAFINAVRAQSGKKIPTSDANALIAAARKIIALLK